MYKRQVRDRDVYLDSRLDMRAHIGKIVSVCFFHLWRLRHLSHTINPDVRHRLVSALVLSRIDYCNVIFAGLPATTLAPLRRVMNAAIRFVAGLRLRDHVSSAQRDLHWLPTEQRIVYKLCVMMHAVHIGNAPKYIPCHASISPWMTSPSTIGCSWSLRCTLDKNTHWLEGLFYCRS